VSLPTPARNPPGELLTLLELLLAQNVEEFNGRRGQRVTLDLFAADLANLSLPAVDLSGANLEKADFSSSDLTGANLSKATLVGADFTGARLTRVVAIKSRLREAYLGGADLAHAELSGADLSEADLSTANLNDARLAGARLREVSARHASLDRADLSEAKLTAADFREADFVDATLRGADLSRATLDGASLEGADLTGARLTGASLKGARLYNTKLNGADLSTADLTGALTDETTDFEGADLTDAVLDLALAERLRAGPPPVVAGHEAATELHFDEPSVAQAHGYVAALWFNVEDGETEVLRLAVRPLREKGEAGAAELPVSAAQVVARQVVPSPTGFRVVLLVDKPGGMDVTVFDVSTTGVPGPGRTMRLGYAPTTLPVIVGDGDGVLIYGIGRGMLSVHRWSPEGLVERLRAPASTYRGFCDRLNPVVLGKGGTVTAVEDQGIGRLVTAPAGFPGRLQAACALREDLIALAWITREEKGVRLQRLGLDTEPLRLDAKHPVGSVDVRAAAGGWWVAWMREPVADRDVPMPMAMFLPASGEPQAPMAILGTSELEDLEDLRFVAGEGAPILAAVALDESLLVLEITPKGGRVLLRVR
jgi:uncharacterized protein YjbI with pentapeptide repeats